MSSSHQHGCLPLLLLSELLAAIQLRIVALWPLCSGDAFLSLDARWS